MEKKIPISLNLKSIFHIIFKKTKDYLTCTLIVYYNILDVIKIQPLPCTSSCQKFEIFVQELYCLLSVYRTLLQNKKKYLNTLPILHILITNIKTPHGKCLHYISFFLQWLRLKATIRIISDKTLFSVSPFFDNLISFILFIQCISRQI